MSERQKVTLVAVWDFTGPEGSDSGVGKGLVRRGWKFRASPARANELIASKKARLFTDLPPVPLRQPPMPGPSRFTAEHPAIFKYDDLTAMDVLDKIEEGVLTVNQAIELEETREPSRSTLLARLRKLSGER